MENKKMNNKGFSLVELIIVIAIMAILVGALAPQFLKYVERSRKSTDVQNVAAMITACQVYAADPMVAAANKIADDETITLKTDSQTVATACSGHAKDALSAAGIANVQLKSSEWKDAGGDVQIKIDVDSDGNVTFSEVNVKSGMSLINGKY